MALAKRRNKTGMCLAALRGRDGLGIEPVKGEERSE
jgi:hypothetical protein